MKKIKVSIIVPIYNVEKYLDRCLESILNQTLKEIEIVAINDGSTDKSLEILQKYINNFNIKLINKANGGLSSARNVGLENAKGEYIAFVDSDDFIHKEMYEELYTISQGSDVVFCGYNKFYSNKIEESDILKKLKLFEENRKYLGIEMYKHELVTVWNKIYRREFLEKNKFKFVEGIIHEDDEFSLKVFSKAESVKFIKKNFYFYRLDNQSSITKNIDFIKKEKAYIEVLKTIEKLKNETDDTFANLRLFIKLQKYKILKKDEIDINLIIRKIKKELKKIKKNNVHYNIILEDLLDLLKEKEVLYDISLRNIFILKRFSKIFKVIKYKITKIWIVSKVN